MFAGKLPRYSHKKCFNGKGISIKKVTILSNKHKQIEFKGTTNRCHKLASTNIWEDSSAFKQLGKQVEFKGTTNRYVWRESGPSLRCLVISCSQEHRCTYILFVFFVTFSSQHKVILKKMIMDIQWKIRSQRWQSKNEPKLLCTIQ